MVVVIKRSAGFLYLRHHQHANLQSALLHALLKQLVTMATMSRNAPVYDDHVEVVPVVVLHLSSSLNDVLQLVVVHLLQVVHLPTLQLGKSDLSFTEFGNNQKERLACAIFKENYFS